MNKASTRVWLILLALLLPIFAFARAPSVSVSIAPLHSLVTQLGQGVFVPELIYSTDQSPHSAALRPSQLKNIIDVDVLIWVDETLEQSLGRVINQRKSSGLVLQLYPENDALSYGEDLTLLTNRESLFDTAEHSSVHSLLDGHNHSEHDHGLFDPHFWLSPDNAIKFSRAVSEQLAALDPEHAVQYKANFESLALDLTELKAQLQASTLAIQEKPFIVFHDGFQYFEQAFDLNGVGAVVLIPDQPPGPKTIDALIKAAQAHNVVCLFSEPQYDKKYLTFIQSKLSDAHVDVIDTLGSELMLGSSLYGELLMGLTENMIQCLEPEL